MKHFTDYLNALRAHDIRTVTEHTFRPALETLLNHYAKPGKIKVLHEPRRTTEYGAPDFKMMHSEAIIGYVENKPLLTTDLDKVLQSAQIKKYTALSENLIVTNYLEWIWLHQGKVAMRTSLCSLKELEGGMILPETKCWQETEELLQNFFRQPGTGIGKPKDLAAAMAHRARFLRDFLHNELTEQTLNHHRREKLHGLYETFKNNVFAELEVKEFADAFAQTLVYGLFIAKLNAGDKTIDLSNAKSFILPAFGLIRELVDFLDEMNKPAYIDARWIIEDVLGIMNTLDLPRLQKQLSYTKYKTTNLWDEDSLKYRDPFIYFYEDFLSAYDKALRKSKGVYYTPPQVVSFITRSVNHLLKDVFAIAEGFADTKRVTVLDFATGTGTFLLEILEQVLDTLPEHSGKTNSVIREHVLKNFFGFEYLIAPYTVANLKLSQFLKERGFKFGADDRFQIYLTNTLEPVNAQINMPLLPALSRESRAAQQVKNKPVLVITGNPPYSGISRNNGKWISDLINDYKYVDGHHFGEKKHWLGNDYVKFIRFAQDKMEYEYIVDEVSHQPIRKVVEHDGVIALITDNSFLDNPTFRGMRQSLMNTFDQLFFLNLHGNYEKKEKTPHGEKDENVFDIKQGVSISFLIKKKGLPKQVFYSDLWGSRKEKYTTLLNTNINDTDWKELQPSTPFYFFIPQDDKYKVAYQEYWSVKDIFHEQSVGAVTGRNALTMDFTKEEMWRKAESFSKMDAEEARLSFQLGENSQAWTIEGALADVKKNLKKDKLIPIAFSPFNERITLYTATSNGFYSRPQARVLNNLLTGKNIGLVVPKQSKEDWGALVTSTIIAHKLVAAYDINYLFPLYTYVDILGKVERQPNFTGAFQKEPIFTKHSPEEILAYIYAILYSPAYRAKYATFLKSDFPRIPFTKDAAIFTQLAAAGQSLIDAHLMQHVPAYKDFPYGSFIGDGDSKVLSREWREDDKKSGYGDLFINKMQHFRTVPKAVYQYYIGGYQVLDKYLKDRSGRVLTLDEINNVETVVRVIAFTIQQAELLGKLTEEWI